jgi:5-methylcytosine-specific restriction protein B
MFETINQRIEFLYDRDHRLWHSFFMTLRENNSLEKLNEIFYNNIIPLLQEYFYEDWEKIQIVLWDHKNQKTKWKDDKLIQEETQSELNTIGFNHEDMEDKAKYIVNKLPNEKSYLWIYSKTIDEETK